MSKECDNNCQDCTVDCKEKTDFREKPHPLSHIKKVIGVVSGKGGVGKSLVTSLLAVTMRRKGYSCALLDADITGPSIPKIFGIKQKASGSEGGILPVKSKTGIGIMSVNLLLPNETDPVVWRGPIIANTVKQFWTDVIWGDIDFLFIDMPPGTGDVALTVFQSVPIDGIIVVTSPQQLVSMIVEKSVKMAGIMSIPLLGLVENMSYVLCPHCGKDFPVFGQSDCMQTAKRYGVSLIDKLPVEPSLSALCDEGNIELFSGEFLENTAALLKNMIKEGIGGLKE